MKKMGDVMEKSVPKDFEIGQEGESACLKFDND